MNRSNNFDAVRILAALAVMVSHQYALTGRPEPVVRGADTLGGLGVLVFFSISGYLVAQSWSSDPNLWRFAARRLLRIWPGYAVALLLALFVLGPAVSTLDWAAYVAHPHFERYLQNFWFDLFDQLPLQFTGNAMPYAIDGSLWTIPLELGCYAMLAVLGLLGLLRAPRWLAAATGLAMAAFILSGGTTGLLAEHFGVASTPVYLTWFGLYFFAGASLQRLGWLREPLQRRRVALWALGLGVASLLVTRNAYLALWLALPAGVLAVGLSSWPLLRRAGRFGDLSYGLYIYAFPVQQTTLWLTRGRLGPLASLLLAAGVTAVLAFLSWHLVEKWALRLKPRTPAAAPLA